MLSRCFISLSIDVLPQIREYERTSTTVINSYVGPPVKAYLRSLMDQMAKGGVKTTGTLSVISVSGLWKTLGALRPINPTTKNKKQMELTQAKVRQESLHSCGRHKRAEAESMI